MLANREAALSHVSRVEISDSLARDDILCSFSQFEIVGSPYVIASFSLSGFQCGLVSSLENVLHPIWFLFNLVKFQIPFKNIYLLTRAGAQWKVLIF